MSNVEKNKRIKESGKFTREKRKTQKCFVFSTKIDYSKLNKQQREQLKMLFVESKRFYNDILNFMDNGGKLADYDTKKTAVFVKQKDVFVEKPLKFLTSSYKQTLVEKVRDSLHSLKKLKEKGYKVGKLKFKSDCYQLNLRQLGVTHRIKSLNKVSIQGIKGCFRVHGLEQFVDNPNAEIANAKLLKKPDGYYINWTVYIAKDKLPVIEKKDNVIGIDFGCGTSFTFSDGRKLDFKLKEPECVKKLQKSLSRKRRYETSKKHSNQYKSVQRKLKKKYQKLANKKNDTSNKLCHELTFYKQVVIQDENLRGWKKSGHGKSVQHSILGRVKSKLKTMSNVTVLSRFAPTTKLCFKCGEIHKEIKLWDRVFKCDCGICMDRDVHAAQCMVWMYQTAYKIPAERRNTMQAEIKTSGQYDYKNFSCKKKAKF